MQSSLVWLSWVWAGQGQPEKAPIKHHGEKERKLLAVHLHSVEAQKFPDLTWILRRGGKRTDQQVGEMLWSTSQLLLFMHRSFFKDAFLLMPTQEEEPCCAGHGNQT